MLARFMLFSTVLALSSLNSGVTHAQDLNTSDRLVIKMKGAAVFGHRPSVRQLESESQRIQTLSAQTGNALNWVRPSADGANVLKFNRNVAPSEKLRVLSQLRAHPDVEWVEIDRRLKTQAAGPIVGLTNVLNTSSRSWFLKLIGEEPASTNTASMWTKFHGDSSAVTAVIDTGILQSHPSLQGHLLQGFDMVSDPFIANDNQALGSGSDRDVDPSDTGNGVTAADLLVDPDCGRVSNSSWHGTFVAALIAGNPMQGEQIFPMNWHGYVLPVRALGKCGGFTSDLSDALRWSVGLPVPNTPVNKTPAKTVNMSLGATGPCVSSIEGAAVSAAISAGAVVIAAAGNSSSGLDSPANCSGVISVGALDEEGYKANYSNFGSNLTLMAPGGDSSFPMWSASNSGTSGPTTNTYAPKIGTSFAAPLVAATVSMMRSLNPRLTPADIVTILRQTSRPFLAPDGNVSVCTTGSVGACKCTTSTCGSGMLDAASATASARANATIANLLGPTVVAPGGSAQLDASQSFNPNSGALNYSWSLLKHTTSAPPVLNNTSSATLDVQFPNEAGAYRFSLTVSNGNSSHTVVKDVITATAGTANADILASLTNVVTSAALSPITGTETGLDTTSGAGSTNSGDASADPGAGSASGAPSSGGGGGQLPLGMFGWLAAGLYLLRKQVNSLAAGACSTSHS